MKILHIINNLGSGGAEKLLEECLPLMNNIEGIEADILLLTDKNNVFDKKLKESGVKIDVVPLRKPRNPINIYYIRRYILEGKYDIVHAHLFPTIYWTSIASKLIFKNKPKFIMTEHNTQNRRREKSYFRYLEKFIYSSYDKIISISQQTQDNLISWIKPKQKSILKFIVIENGINIKKFIEAKPYNKLEINNKFTQDTKLICMVGSFKEQKDQATLIRAMKKLPYDIHLLLIGEGPLKEKNQTLVKEIGVEGRVHFLGFRNDIPSILKTVDIVVLSSHWEGFGLAVVEGMAAGKPVIASDVPGLREIINGAGVLFSKGDSMELATKINELFKEKDKYNDIAIKCQLKSNYYSIEKMVERYINVYRKLFRN
ncbi:glycosyltransferase [Thermoanaerobacteraceae bacterium SP2]|nr:glycosyltransferase [Thermoanaerobacteraceae bacterium SP2]